VPEADVLQISCATSSFCVTLGGPGPQLATYNGTWNTVSPFPGVVTALSCFSINRCAAVDTNGYTLTWNGASWTQIAPVNDTTTYSAISCITATICAAVGFDYSTGPVAAELVGSIWRNPVPLQSVSQLYDIACASATVCVAVGLDPSGAVAATFDGTSWSAPVNVLGNTNSNLLEVACASTTLCEATGFEDSALGTQQGVLATYDGTAWTPKLLTRDPGPLSVSCAPTTTWCLASDTAAGKSYTYNAGTWKTSTAPTGGALVADISCYATQRCVAGGATTSPQIWIYDAHGFSPSEPTPTPPSATAVIGIACPSASWCASLPGIPAGTGSG
jgi:hypothetical protein